jgi:hypothetical protein
MSSRLMNGAEQSRVVFKQWVALGQALIVTFNLVYCPCSSPSQSKQGVFPGWNKRVRENDQRKEKLGPCGPLWSVFNGIRDRGEKREHSQSQKHKFLNVLLHLIGKGHPTCSIHSLLLSLLSRVVLLNSGNQATIPPQTPEC